jgi:hypothetical protein
LRRKESQIHGVDERDEIDQERRQRERERERERERDEMR